MCNEQSERRIVVERVNDGYFNVIENGKVAHGLTWDEMLGQLISLTIPTKHIQRNGGVLYRMQDRETVKARAESGLDI